MTAMGKQNRQQRRAADRDKEAYGFAKLASLKIAPKSPPPKPRRKLSRPAFVAIIVMGILLTIPIVYVAFFGRPVVYSVHHVPAK